MLSRDDIFLAYLDTLPYAPYPLQEDALMQWFSHEQGILLSAPTGTGKTLVAEGALYEALHSGTTAYYTTPLIALTDQKFEEMRETVQRWGFPANEVGLVTGNRSVNPEARIKVVVAEILLNRLLHREAFDFGGVGAVVMDEFHSFADRDRGIVWEMTLDLLPRHVRLMLLSATVGNASQFLSWLRRNHQRDLRLVQGTERKVPLYFHWIGEELLADQLTAMSRGSESERKTPALVFAFDRESCWTTAEQLKGRNLLQEGQQAQLAARLEGHDWTHGAGAKLKAILMRGVGVHHAGVLPRYRRIVEELFQDRLLSVCVCTETLAAGINLPARSVVLTELVKGPPKARRLIEASAAHQMFGRAGRPQFDTEGHVYALAHEDDVKIARWRQKYDAIPEDTKDPKLLAAKKSLKKKMPTRRSGVTYWNEDQFAKLQTAPPADLASHGELPWRLMAYVLDIDPHVELLRDVASKRLMEPRRIEAEQKRVTRMLVTMHEHGYVVLEPPPPPKADAGGAAERSASGAGADSADTGAGAAKPAGGALSEAIREMGLAKALEAALGAGQAAGKKDKPPSDASAADRLGGYEPVTATPTAKLKQLLVFRAVDAMYGGFLLEYLGLADRHEKLQILESLMEMPGSVARRVRVPWPDQLPPGALAVDIVDPLLLRRGIASMDDLYPDFEQQREQPPELRKYPVPLGDKMLMLYQSEVTPQSPRITSVWAAGELLEAGGNFDQFVRAKDLVKQEGIMFRHLLRLILLCDEFAQVTPSGMLEASWRGEMRELSEALTASCRGVDPDSTEKLLESARAMEKASEAV